VTDLCLFIARPVQGTKKISIPRSVSETYFNDKKGVALYNDAGRWSCFRAVFIQCVAALQKLLPSSTPLGDTSLPIMPCHGRLRRTSSTNVLEKSQAPVASSITMALRIRISTHLLRRVFHYHRGQVDYPQLEDQRTIENCIIHLRIHSDLVS
jgi:hypothetical protein